MTYYAKPTCVLTEDMIKDIGGKHIVMGQYLRCDKFREMNLGFYNGLDYFSTQRECYFLGYEGFWQLLTEDMFNPDEKDAMKMFIPDLDWFPNHA